MDKLTIENTPVDMLNSLNVLIEWYNECEKERWELKNRLNTKYGTGVNAALFTYQDTDTIRKGIMTFSEIFKMVKTIVNAHTYSGCTNGVLLQAATQIYCKQMEVESVIRKSNHEKAAQSSETEK